MNWHSPTLSSLVFPHLHIWWRIWNGLYVDGDDDVDGRVAASVARTAGS